MTRILNYVSVYCLGYTVAGTYSNTLNVPNSYYVTVMSKFMQLSALQRNYYYLPI